MRTRCLNVVRGDRFACRLVTNRPVIADLNTSRNLRLGGCLLVARRAMRLELPKLARLRISAAIANRRALLLLPGRSGPPAARASCSSCLFAGVLVLSQV